MFSDRIFLILIFNHNVLIVKMRYHLGFFFINKNWSPSLIRKIQQIFDTYVKMSLKIRILRYLRPNL